MLDSIRIGGFRGFATGQLLKFSKPDGAPGSGLTVLVGANNTGKSSVIEALRAIRQLQPPAISQGRRNQSAGDRVEIVAASGANWTRLRTLPSGGSETEREVQGGGPDLSRVLILPSRRFFNPHFHKATWTRDEYTTNTGFPAARASTLDQITNRLFAVNRNREAFDHLFAKLVSPLPNWTIDLLDTNQHFLKFQAVGGTHSSEGLGEGLVSLLYIVDALYDSQAGDFIAIDEPELSLHPTLQRRLADVLSEYSATRQILIATHSPLLIDLDALGRGLTVARTHIRQGGVTISQLSTPTALQLCRFLKDLNNPHILGLNAREIFFADDKVVLVEGQEDVIFFDVILRSLGVRLDGSFFGWGVGGAGNMGTVAQVLQELGFSRVVGILDGDKATLAVELRKRFPEYHFVSHPAQDVRTKPATPAKLAVVGLLDERNENLRPEYADAVSTMFAGVGEYLAGTREPKQSSAANATPSNSE